MQPRPGRRVGARGGERIYASGGDPLGDPDWIELKNLADQPADLSGFRLRDDKTLFTLPTEPPSRRAVTFGLRR